MPEIGTESNIWLIRFAEQAGNPDTPTATFSGIYMKADGLYAIDDAGTVTGPLVDATGAVVGVLLADGSVPLAGAWDMGSQILTNVNIDSGVITGITDLAIADGGTAASTAADARTNLGLVSGGAGDIWVEKAGDSMTGPLQLENTQYILNDGTDFDTAKFNSQGVAWSAASTLQSILIQGAFNEQPEISWYRGSRTYPEASIRKHTTSDRGLQFWVGGGVAAPVLTLSLESASAVIGSDTAEGRLTINGAAASDKFILFQTASSPRWVIRSTGAETGGDAGSNLQFDRRDDAGAYVDSPLTLERSTGYIQIANRVSLAGQLAMALSSDVIGLVITGNAAQTLDLQQWRNSSSGVVHASGDGLAGSEWVHNSGGIDIDFRVESLTYDALLVDASNDAIEVMKNAAGKIGFYAATPIVQPTEITDELTGITHTAPGTPDYALQDLVDSGVGSAWGFATHDEGNTLLSVVANLQTRQDELETVLSSLGLLADAD